MSSQSSSGALTRTTRVLAVATLASTLGLIVLGSAVRVTDSGMGCRGWPLCSGAVGPLHHFHPLMEQSHRFLATLVTVLVVVVAIVAWRGGAATRRLRALALAAVGVIGAQVVLGAVTVVTNNAPVTVALHLLAATLLLGVVTVAAVASFVPPGRSWSPWRGPGRLAWAAVGALYLMVVSGSVVVNAGAQAACRAWPACVSSPAATGLLVVQMTHRSVVLVGGVLVVAYLAGTWRSARAERVERRLAALGLLLLVAQVGVGATSAIMTSHTEVADVHLALAATLWSTVVAVVVLRSRERGAPVRLVRVGGPDAVASPDGARRPATPIRVDRS